jgi:predicted transcriptional regulator
MLIKELMHSGIAECTEDTSLTDVYDLIQNSPEGFVVVLDSVQHRVPIGIVNEHSICDNIIRRNKNARSLDAGGVINTKVKRISEDTPVAECGEVLRKKLDAILVVDNHKRFRGVVEKDQLERSMPEVRAPAATPSIFSGMLAQQLPASVEIPAFGWLK